MDSWNGLQRDDWDRPRGNSHDEPPQEKYLGLTATQFNVTVLGIIGAIAIVVGLFVLGGAGAVGDFFSGGDDSSSESAAVVKTVTPSDAEATPDATPAPVPTSEGDEGTGDRDSGAPTPTSAPTPAPAPTVVPDDIADEGDSGTPVEQVLNTFDPFTLMGALGSSGSPADISISGPDGTTFVPSDQADDSLKAIVVQQGDLPPGFSSLGEMSFSVPTGQATADMVASMFATGDLDSGDLGTMVISAVMVGPDVTAELGNFDELEEMTQADLDEAAAAMEEFGVTLIEMELLDASGLGDAGMGMHMVMDFSGMFDAFGMPQDESVPSGIAWDMYAFAQGERLLMVMVMWLPDGVSGVDAHALAEIMDARAAVQ